MVKNQILQVSSGLLFLALLGGCSSNNIKPVEQAEVATPMVVAPTYNKKTTIIKNKVVNKRRQHIASRKKVVRKKVARKKVARKKVVRKKVVKKKINYVANNYQRIAQQRAAQQRATQQKMAQWRAAEQKAEKERAAQKWLAGQQAIKQKSMQKWFAEQKATEQRIEQQRRKNLYLAQRKVSRKVNAPRKSYAPRLTRVVRKAPRRVYVRPQTAIRQYRPQPRVQPRIQPRIQRSQPRKQQPQYHGGGYLAGDFANNPKAQRFVDKMVARHGFDRNYIIKVISNARATDWMRKMAAKDDNPIKRKKKRRSRASWSRYRSHFLTSRHINAGVAFYHQNRQALEQAERQFGVLKEYIMGILGVETIFGGNVGKNRAIDALTTMAFNTQRRSHYFESELESYLLMTRKARLDPLQPKASYAGALGLCQFMPSNIKKYGVDFDGDGGVNLWKPADAIASVARYFKGHGWRTGEMVAVPAQSRGGRYRTLKVGFKYKYSPSRLARKGISASYPHNMNGSLRFIKLNTNRGDELWLGGKNFYVITRYNHSTHYAMAVHQLAQAIKQRIEPGSRSPRMIQPRIAPTNKRSISVEEAMELLSASNEHKGALTELRELIAKETLS